jgi:hypothetical protein
MSSQFKFKPDKIKFLSTIDTLDSSHKKIVDNINKKRIDVPNKQEKLQKLKNKLKILDSKNSEIINYINTRTLIIDKINVLEEEINKIQNYEDELEYYEKTYEILFNYYDIVDGHKIVSNQCDFTQNNPSSNFYNHNNQEQENIKQENQEQEIQNLKEKEQKEKEQENQDLKQKDQEKEQEEKDQEEKEQEEKDQEEKDQDKMSGFISDIQIEPKKDEWEDEITIFKKSTEPSTLDILNQISKLKRKEKKTTKKRVKNVESLVRDNNNIFDYLEGKQNPNEKNNENNENKEKHKEKNKESINKYDRASLFEDYKILLEGYIVQKKVEKPCINCGPNVNKILNYSEGIYVCTNCGEVEKCIIENEITNYKDPMVEKPTFPYKRKNHFCEWTICLYLFTAHKSRY